MRIDEDVLKKAKEHGINVSAFLEIKLREYLALIEGKHNNSSLSPPSQEPQSQFYAGGRIRALTRISPQSDALRRERTDKK